MRIERSVYGSGAILAPLLALLRLMQGIAAVVYESSALLCAERGTRDAGRGRGCGRGRGRGCGARARVRGAGARRGRGARARGAGAGRRCGARVRGAGAGRGREARGAKKSRCGMLEWVCAAETEAKRDKLRQDMGTKTPKKGGAKIAPPLKHMHVFIRAVLC